LVVVSEGAVVSAEVKVLQVDVEAVTRSGVSILEEKSVESETCAEELVIISGSGWSSDGDNEE
jgi:hypothetical protein